MADIQYVSAWQKRDAALERDAVSLWRKHNILPAGVTPEDRVGEICCLAYDGEQLAAISTIDVRSWPPLRGKRFGFLRVFTSPDYEGQEISIGLAKACRRILEDWSIARPAEQLAGMAAIYQSPKYGKYPVGKSGLTLVGFTPEGHQVVLVWFNHLPV